MTQLSLARLTVITALALCLPYPAQAYDLNARHNCTSQLPTPLWTFFNLPTLEAPARPGLSFTRLCIGGTEPGGRPPR